jgi:hypothetical protein
MIFKFIVGCVLVGSSCKWRHLVLEASRLLSLCLVVPPCWRRFITSLNKSRLHQNPIFCLIFLLFFLFVCFFSFCLLAGLRTAQKRRQISIRRHVCALWPTGWSRLSSKPTYKMSVIFHRKRFYVVLKDHFPSFYNQNYCKAAMNIYWCLSTPLSSVTITSSAPF